jgi:hypothetical protein
MLQSLTNLRVVILRVGTGLEHYRVKDFDFEDLSSRLIRLELHFPTLRFQPDEPLATCFPHLESLKLGMSRPWKLDSYTPLPSSLTSLEVEIQGGDALTLPPNFVTPNLLVLCLKFPCMIKEELVNWPKWLLRMNIQLKMPDSLDKLAMLFPPTLTDLSITWFDWLSNRGYVIQSRIYNPLENWGSLLEPLKELTTLGIEIMGPKHPNFQSDYPSPACLSPRLTELRIVCEDHRTPAEDIIDSYTGQLLCLKRFLINGKPVNFKRVRKPSNGIKPLSLKPSNLDCDFISIEDLNSQDQMADILLLPQSLTKLELTFVPRILTPNTEERKVALSQPLIVLPPQLLTLKCSPSIGFQGSGMLNLLLPSSLTHLDMHQSSVASISGPRSRFPDSITKLKYDLLPLPCLSSIPRNVTHLSLNMKPLAHEHELPTENISKSMALPQSFWDAPLPTSITTLKLQVAFHEIQFWMELIASPGTSTSLPRLSYLKIRPNKRCISSPQRFGLRTLRRGWLTESPFPFLTPTLSRLTIPFSLLQKEWLLDLPCGLRNLNFTRDWTALLCEDLELLPRDLATLKCSVHRYEANPRHFVRFHKDTRLAIFFVMANLGITEMPWLVRGTTPPEGLYRED